MQSPASGMDGVLLDKQNQIDTFTFGNYIFKISHDNTIGWNGHKMDSLWDATGAIIIQTAPDEFIVGGTGIIINFSCTDTAYNAGILAIENGTFDNGKWQPNLRLNGDEDHQGRHLRIPLDEWDIQRVKLYRYK